MSEAARYRLMDAARRTAQLNHPDARHLTPEEAQRVFAVLTEIADTAHGIKRLRTKDATAFEVSSILLKVDIIRDILQGREQR